MRRMAHSAKQCLQISRPLTQVVLLMFILNQSLRAIGEERDISSYAVQR